jgi:exopolysaccharide biosynthesis polyprenyl glycosylphosphotransferase
MTDSRRPLRAGLSLAERQVVLFAGDLACVALAIALSLVIWIWMGGGSAHPLSFLREKDAFSPYLWLVPLWFFLIVHLYDPHSAFSRERTLFGLALAAGISFIPYLGMYFLAPPGTLPRITILVFLVAVTALELAWRLIAIRLFTLPGLRRPVLVIGAGRAGNMILTVLREAASGHFRIDGLIDDDREKLGKEFQGIPVLGGADVLREEVRKRGITLLVLAISGEINAELFQAILDCQEQGAEVVRMPTLYESLLGRVPIAYLDADWLLTSFLDSARLYGLYDPLKRLIDLIIGIAGAVAWLVLTPLLAVLIRLDSRGPILYGQDRSGKGGKVFRVWKFRTMVAHAEADGEARWASAEDPRVTRVGKWMRRTRLDEMPQFWNVLRGEMSFIGPRPERPEWISQLEKQIPFYRARLLVQPGITGWSQVNYGYARTVEDTALKLEFDLYYIRHRSLTLDLKIMLRTLVTILRFQGS